MKLLTVTEQALVDMQEKDLLKPLWQLVEQKTTPAQEMCNRWQAGEPLVDILRAGYHSETKSQEI